MPTLKAKQENKYPEDWPKYKVQFLDKYGNITPKPEAPQKAAKPIPEFKILAHYPKIAELWNEGRLTAHEIGLQFGLTKQRIFQIVMLMGCKRRGRGGSRKR